MPVAAALQFLIGLLILSLYMLAVEYFLIPIRQGTLYRSEPNSKKFDTEAKCPEFSNDVHSEEKLFSAFLRHPVMDKPAF